VDCLLDFSRSGRKAEAKVPEAVTPQEYGFETFLSRFLMFLKGPGMDSNAHLKRAVS
jgi:hypothetical protein